MEVMGSPPMDHFDFNYDSRILPYLSAPSSPKRFGEIYMSAPTSPSRISEFYREFEYFSISSPAPYEEEDGFAFSVEESQKSPRSAEELFDGGRIKPLKNNNELFMESARSPLLLSPERSSSPSKRSALTQGKKAIREAFSPRKNTNITTNNNTSLNEDSRRGRDRTPSISSSNSSRRRATRSHSPYREHHYSFDDESQHKQQQQQQPESDNSNNKEDVGVVVTKGSVLSSTSASSKSSRKWRLRDFLLFRSASEGRGSSKDPFRKYPILFKKAEEGKGGSSFRSSENNNNNNNNAAPRSRRKEPVSAHELHYARKKAETEDLKKRTFLPYKQGILGRLAGFTR